MRAQTTPRSSCVRHWSAWKPPCSILNCLSWWVGHDLNDFSSPPVSHVSISKPSRCQEYIAEQAVAYFASVTINTGVYCRLLWFYLTWKESCTEIWCFIMIWWFHRPHLQSDSEHLICRAHKLYFSVSVAQTFYCRRNSRLALMIALILNPFLDWLISCLVHKVSEKCLIIMACWRVVFGLKYVQLTVLQVLNQSIGQN